MKRNEIKDAHENSVLENFKKYYSKSNNIVEIIGKPEPPDAIVTINGNKTWIEITDAFFSSELAESITTYVAEDKVHKPVPRKKCFVIEPNAQFSSILKNVIERKYDKQSIGRVYQQYGRGILLVGIINPFALAENLVETEKQKILNLIKSKEERFTKIYLYEINNHAFFQLI